MTCDEFYNIKVKSTKNLLPAMNKNFYRAIFLLIFIISCCSF